MYYSTRYELVSKRSDLKVFVGWNYDTKQYFVHLTDADHFDIDANKITREEVRYVTYDLSELEKFVERYAEPMPRELRGRLFRDWARSE